MGQKKSGMFNGQCSAVGVRLQNTFIISFDQMYAQFAEAIDEMGTCLPEKPATVYDDDVSG